MGALDIHAGGIAATLGVIASGVVGRRGQNRQWLQESRTAVF
ncbi:hypothetical protein [Streptomyces sp. NPDC058394]